MNWEIITKIKQEAVKLLSLDYYQRHAQERSVSGQEKVAMELNQQ